MRFRVEWPRRPDTCLSELAVPSHCLIPLDAIQLEQLYPIQRKLPLLWTVLGGWYLNAVWGIPHVFVDVSSFPGLLGGSDCPIGNQYLS